MKSINVFILSAILAVLVVSLFPQDSHEVIFVLSHGRVRALRRSEVKRVISHEPSKDTDDLDTEAKKRRKRARNKRKKKLRAIRRWFRHNKLTAPKWLKSLMRARRQKKRRLQAKAKKVEPNSRVKSMFQILADKNKE